MKRCGKCSTIKPLGDFYASRKRSDGKQSWCIACQKVSQKAYGTENAEDLRSYKRKWQKNRHVEALIAYSEGAPTCCGCGEKDVNVLTLHHMNNDGNEHRKSVGTGVQFINHLRLNGWPNEPPLAVLCWNCNHRVRVGVLDLGVIYS